MYRKIIVCLLVFTALINSNLLASNAENYLTTGRAQLFDGTLDGIRNGYQTFDNGLKDAGCGDCQTSRELKFFHALSRTAMLVVKDDAGNIDSAFEQMDKFGINISGQFWAPYFRPARIEFSETKNQHDYYEIPDDAPDVNDLRKISEENFIPEIEAIIAELDSIIDSPTNRFRVYLSADELRIFHAIDYEFENPLEPVEVDYGEVLMLKGILTFIKAQLEYKAAYDLYVSPNAKLYEKYYGGNLKISDDIFSAHPDFLKVLPTPSDSNDGKAALAQIKQEMINGINYYLDSVEYIRGEEDEQEDDFFYIAMEDEFIADEIEKKLVVFRDSIMNDTVAELPMEKTKTFGIYDAGSAYIGELTLVYNFTDIEGDEGSLTFTDGVTPTPWDIDWFGVTATRFIEIEFEYYGNYEWRQGYLEGFLSEDGNNILNATFEYWGNVSGTLNNLSADIESIEVENGQIDLNPVFGSSARYPNPVNPRDLLPVFDEWNFPFIGTFGHGLDNDPTLGGIVPEMTQEYWQKEFDLQPSGLIYLDYKNQQPIYLNGYLDDWQANQIILNDPSGDAVDDEDIEELQLVSGTDIKTVYMATDKSFLFGAIETYDDFQMDNYYCFNIFMTYIPQDTSALCSIKFVITRYGDGSVIGEVYYMDNSYREKDWYWFGEFQAVRGQNCIEFIIWKGFIPDNLPGRFIIIESEGSDPYGNYNSEENYTNLRIGELGSISGTIEYDGHQGDPIFIQAYTEAEDPEESIVASTMITEPGQYTLEGVPMGWQGFVRAFTPLFGFENPFALEAFNIENARPLSMMYDDLENVDIEMKYPVELKNNIPTSGHINSETTEPDWFYFDAVEGRAYWVDIFTNELEIALYDRNAKEEMEFYGEWVCPVSGRYYVKVYNSYYWPIAGNYELTLNTNAECPRADIANSEWPGVKDCRVDFYDLAVLVSTWLEECDYPYWCEKADFDQSGRTDFSDFNIFAEEWMTEIGDTI
ncbi:MAG: hypothetical protein A2Y10_02660 [Planctomycetes bacterium GWF2_41_51]|nr:MAG: hypothetical protein A2Y10_02660 [Planctomycetes bacterium GWF2_41_51]HBG27451.1 hypothetical protein [Phycisphaerales bacterium]